METGPFPLPNPLPLPPKTFVFIESSVSVLRIAGVDTVVEKPPDIWLPNERSRRWISLFH